MQLSLELKALSERVRTSPEWQVASEVARELRCTLPGRDENDARKFLNLDWWLNANLSRIFCLGLHKQKSLKVLDLGSGPGLFAFVCKCAGHEVLGVDLPEHELETPEREVYTIMPRIFRVQTERKRIAPFQPVTLSGQYDLITGFLVSFNNHRIRDEWRKQEWEYFINDILPSLRPGGRLVIQLNEHAERYGALEYFDVATKAYFESIGSLIKGTLLIPEKNFEDADPEFVLLRDMLLTKHQ